MLEMFTSPYLILFARVCVGGVLVTSAVTKLRDREGTATSLSRYHFLPEGMGAGLASYFPLLEFAVGTLLVAGLFTLPAAIIGTLMFMLFTGLTVYDLRNDSHEACHCFGRLSSERVTLRAVVRDLLLMALVLVVALCFDGWVSLDSVMPYWPGHATGLLAGGLLSRAIPGPLDAVPVMLLAITCTALIVLEEQAISMVRTTLRVMGLG
jgi:uncharacterized membrane protein YphA (DoxX/SURF4 family)